MFRTLLFTTCSFLLAPLHAQVLDASFATAGELLVATPTSVDEAQDMELMPDGRIVTCGRSGPNGQSLIAAWRYLSDGQPDLTFGIGGMATLSVYGNDYPQAMVLQPDGKVLVCGYTDYTNDSTDLFVVRFTTDGAPDPSFGSNGVVDISTYQRGMQATDLLLAADGGIIIGGTLHPDNGPLDGFVMKLSSDGSLDVSFQGGTVPLPNPLGGTSGVLSIASDAQGRIIAAGEGRGSVQVTNAQWMAWRLLADGTLDPDFATGGIYWFDFTNYVDRFTTVTVQPDGRILLGGIVGLNTTSLSLFALRLLEDGADDPDWLNNGLIYFDGYSPAELRTFAVEPDGHVLFSGSVRTQVGGRIAGYLARTDANGALDPNFGTNGIHLVGPDPGYTYFNKGLLQQDGRWTLAGSRTVSGYPDVLLQRYFPDLPLAVPSAFSTPAAQARYVNGRFLLTGQGAASASWCLSDACGRTIPVRSSASGEERVLQPSAQLPAGMYVLNGVSKDGVRHDMRVVVE